MSGGPAPIVEFPPRIEALADGLFGFSWSCPRENIAKHHIKSLSLSSGTSRIRPRPQGSRRVSGAMPNITY